MRNGFAGRGQRLFPGASGRAAGNSLPPATGAPWPASRPGPSPSRYMGGRGQLGGYDGITGADPRAPRIQPAPHISALGDGQETYRRYAIQGFNDQQTTRDRHAYWDTGTQRTGIQHLPYGTPNTFNDPAGNPPAPELRTVNRTVSWQIGSDATRNQDDLSRQYTWLGEQGSGWTRINGGVPGLYQPYGTRGGVPYPIVSPAPQGGQGDGPRSVWSGPPHGLHSRTPWKGGAQIIRRYGSTPQMRPVRFDRPSNSPQAGQSYSQTVRPQGASRVRPPAGGGAVPPGGMVYGGGRGWAGRPAG